MEIKLRPATPTDIKNILHIINHAILHTTSNYNYEVQSIEAQTQWFKDKQSKKLPIIVADYNGTAVGFGSYGQFREKIGYQFTIEHSVYVDDAYIGKGIGKLLLAELIQLATNQGYHTMIGAIDAENNASIAFHEKFGFTVCGNIKQVAYKFDRWLDLVLMQLILN